MTAPAPVSAPTTPVSGHWQVSVHRCLTIACAICGLDVWDEYVVHFDSEHELWEWVSTQGWTIRRDGNVLCPKRSADADCAEHGHHWDDWSLFPGDRDIEYRCCERCSAADERRIDRQRHRCP